MVKLTDFERSETGPEPTYMVEAPAPAWLLPLKVIADERGEVRHMLRTPRWPSEALAFGAAGLIGEVYFSVCNPDAVKAWHLHTRMTLRYVCIYGRALVVTFAPGHDKRPVEHILGGYGASAEEYKMLVIGSGVWNGFRALPILDEDSKPILLPPAIICNAASEAHDVDEIIRISPEAFDVAYGRYDWKSFRVAG